MGNVLLVYLGCSYKHSIRPFRFLLSTASAMGKRLGGVFRPMELTRKRKNTANRSLAPLVPRLQHVHSIVNWARLLWDPKWFESLCCFGLHMDRKDYVHPPWPIEYRIDCTQTNTPGRSRHKVRILSALWSYYILLTSQQRILNSQSQNITSLPKNHKKSTSSASILPLYLSINSR